MQLCLIRSAVMHDMEFDQKLKGYWKRQEQELITFIWIHVRSRESLYSSTPGANANGVKELVIAGMLLASRDIIGGINWVQENEEDGNILKDAEKAKKQFAGCEIEGKKLGVIGLGAIGVLVANAAVHLGMEVYGMIHICLWWQHGDCPEIFIMQRLLMSFIKIVIILRPCAGYG